MARGPDGGYESFRDTEPPRAATAAEPTAVKTESAKEATAKADAETEEPTPLRLKYDFLREAGRLINSGQSRTIVLTGNVTDLFFQNGDIGQYVPLIDLIKATWRPTNRILVSYELNGTIEFESIQDRTEMRGAWIRYRHKSGKKPDKLAEEFDQRLADSTGQPTLALEMLRQLCVCSRFVHSDGTPTLPKHLVAVIEGADMLVPQGEVSRLAEADRQRAAICRDWFSDPGFMNGGDSVILIAETRDQINSLVSKLPQVLSVEIPAPDQEQRQLCIDWFSRHVKTAGRPPVDTGTPGRLAEWTAGLTNHALLQLLKGAAHNGGRLDQQAVVAKVESFIKSQLGEDVIEFKRPTHYLNDLIGNRQLLAFIRKEMIPRFVSSDEDAWSGAVVGGPLGSGKTFIFEAVAAELGMPVLVIKNLRSKWFGETDVILGRLRRTLEALAKALILFDEADTAFADVGGEQHSTEKRLVGALFQMMSDPKLKGKIIWLLMTARVHLLPADMMRPGRVGDLVIPILDPEGEDQLEFLDWTIRGSVELPPDGHPDWHRLTKATKGYSAAQFTLLRKELKAARNKKGHERRLTMEEALTVINEILPPSIEDTRGFQAAQAILHCTRKSLLPKRFHSEKARVKLRQRLTIAPGRGFWARLKRLFGGD